MATVLSRLVPPVSAVRIGLIVVTVMVAIAGAVALIGDRATGIAAALGCLAVLGVALRDAPWRASLEMGAIVAASAAAATVVSGTPALVGLVVAGSVLAAVRLVLALGPVLGAAPVAVATAGTDAATIGPVAAAVGVLAGAVALTAIVRRAMPRRLAPTPPRPAVGWTYVAALALGSGAAIGVAAQWGVPHAIWIVVALAGVLVPAGSDTVRHAVGRVGGTLLGAVVGTAFAFALPSWAIAVVAAAAMVAGVGWSVVRSQAAAGGFYAVAVVLMVASVEPSAAVATAIDRALLTLVGGAIALVLAAVITRVEARGAS